MTTQIENEVWHDRKWSLQWWVIVIDAGTLGLFGLYRTIRVGPCIHQPSRFTFYRAKLHFRCHDLCPHELIKKWSMDLCTPHIFVNTPLELIAPYTPPTCSIDMPIDSYTPPANSYINCFVFQNRPTHVWCTSASSPWHVCWDWPHGRCSTCAATSSPRSW